MPSKAKRKPRRPAETKYRLPEEGKLYTIRIPVRVVLMVIRRSERMGLPANASWRERLMALAGGGR